VPLFRLRFAALRACRLEKMAQSGEDELLQTTVTLAQDQSKQGIKVCSVPRSVH
jgi:hypothetical protein